MKWADLKELEECEELNKVISINLGNIIINRAFQTNKKQKR